jgi:biopolymer transport protein ExbB/TolQ
MRDQPLVFHTPLDQITTVEQCDAEREALADDVADLEAKIAMAKGRAASTGDYSDSRAFHGWIKLLRKKREGLQRVQEVRGRIGKAARRAHDMSEDKHLLRIIGAIAPEVMARAVLIRLGEQATGRLTDSGARP